MGSYIPQRAEFEWMVDDEPRKEQRRDIRGGGSNLVNSSGAETVEQTKPMARDDGYSCLHKGKLMG